MRQKGEGEGEGRVDCRDDHASTSRGGRVQEPGSWEVEVAVDRAHGVDGVDHGTPLASARHGSGHESGVTAHEGGYQTATIIGWPRTLTHGSGSRRRDDQKIASGETLSL